MKPIAAVVFILAVLFVMSVQAIAVDCIEPQCVFGQDVVYLQTQDGDHYSLPRAWGWSAVWCLSGAAGCHTDRDWTEMAETTALWDAANGATDCPNSGSIPVSSGTTGSTSNLTQIATIPRSYCKQRNIGM